MNMQTVVFVATLAILIPLDSSLVYGFSVLEGQSKSRLVQEQRTTTPLFVATADSETRWSSRTASPSRNAITNSVTRPSQASTTSPYWNQFVPSLWENPRGVDVRLSWVTSKDDSSSQAQRMAQLFLDHMQEQNGSRTVKKRNELETELSSWIACFESYCSDTLQKSLENERALTARIVCSRGPASTKCPRWHFDHAPFRWIHSLVGPGCEWVDEQTPLDVWQSLQKNEEHEAIDTESTRAVNGRLVDPTRSTIHQANPGEAVLLLGNKWNQMAAEEQESNLPPVLHKSPDGIPFWQGRILFTMDVLLQEDGE